MVESRGPFYRWRLPRKIRGVGAWAFFAGRRGRRRKGRSKAAGPASSKRPNKPHGKWWAARIRGGSSRSKKLDTKILGRDRQQVTESALLHASGWLGWKKNGWKAPRGRIRSRTLRPDSKSSMELLMPARRFEFPPGVGRAHSGHVR